jgi:branched-chain amino acid transport system substrate-binding protein
LPSVPRPGAGHARVLTLVAAILAAAALAVAGCGGDDESDTTASSAEGVHLNTCDPVEYGGDGEPQGLIVSDLPMRGDSAERSQQQVDAIRLVLEQNGWKAGSTAVGLQACDDSIASTGLWDEATCRSNAHGYADDSKVLGVIGTYNSGCAAEEIPILNKVDLVMISPGNTAVCLTQPSPLCEAGQPNSLYPSGKRTYARVVPNDGFQGAGLAEFAQDEGVKRPYVLYARDDPTSLGQAANFRAAAEHLGLRLAGYASWDPEAKSYASLFKDVKSSGADGVVLAGLTELNGAAVIQEKVRAMGSNEKVPLLAFDGMAQQATIDEAGDSSEGMFASLPGQSPEKLTGEGATLVSDLEQETGGDPVEQFAPPAGEAAAVLLDAIAAAGPERAGIVKAVFATGGGGILDDYTIEGSGDPSVGPITILRAEATFIPDAEIRPEPPVVTAARVDASPAER